MLNWLRRSHHAGNHAILRFRCNICSAKVSATVAGISRENPNCRCGSTLRQRGMVHVLSTELFGRSLTIKDFPDRQDVLGIDMSGASNYARRLARKIGYTNTFYHKEPRLDITASCTELVERYDFIMTSDVLEHVAPPVSVAFDNMYRMLKPGGVLVLTVPYTKTGATQEHFPTLHDYHIDRNGERPILRNVDAAGNHEVFEQLVFHGGEGETLEMRVFSESGILAELKLAGFTDMRIHKAPYYDFGIVWHDDWSLPISARKPATTGAGE